LNVLEFEKKNKKQSDSTQVSRSLCVQINISLKKSFVPKVSQFFVGKMTKAFGKKTVIGTIYEVEYC
jgi:hypothetical protein